jgi:hypothetical protein
MAKTTMITLPVTQDNNDTLEVGLNGTMYLLKRGQPIAVSPALYEILLNAGLLGGDANES